MPTSILFTAVPKFNIDFVWEIITEWTEETDVEITSTESVIKLSKTKVEFLQNLDLLSIEKNKLNKVCINDSNVTMSNVIYVEKVL